MFLAVLLPGNTWWVWARWGGEMGGGAGWIQSAAATIEVRVVSKCKASAEAKQFQIESRRIALPAYLKMT